MPDKRMSNMGEKLCKARQNAGLSQAEVARLLGRTQSYISRCESGKHRLDIFELESFAKLYNLPLSHFIK